MSPPEHPDLARVRDYLAGRPGAAAWLEGQLRLVPRMAQHLAARRGGLGAEDLQDVAQEATLTALRRLEGYHGLAAFGAWLHHVVINTLRRHYRRRRGLETSRPDLEPTDPRATDEAVAREQAARLRRAIDQIGGVEAEVIRMRHFEGLDFPNISERTGIAIATLRTRYYRGLEKLKRRLSPPDEPPASQP